jgi:hypothetical protein
LNTREPIRKTFIERMENYFQNFFPSLLRVKPIVLFFIITSVFLISNTEKYTCWSGRPTPFENDMDQYYSYLPQMVILHDPFFKNDGNRYWTVSLPNGNKVQRFTFGVALLEAPFFFLGHKIAKEYGYSTDGYSPPYAWSLLIGDTLYVLIGLFFLYRALRFYFSEWLSVFVITAIFFATNLFFYTVSQGVMSHSFLFFLQSAFIFFTLSWHRSGRLKHLLLLAVSGGFAALIRPTEILIFVFPLALGVYNSPTIKTRLEFLKQRKWQLILGATLFILVLLPQVIYWKVNTGKLFFYTYGKEGFFFSDPKILKFLFGYRKGLIPYSPIMIFSLLGFIFLWLKHRELFWGILIFNVLNIYVLSSWWDYGYGGSFGNRAMVQSFSSLAFPLAAFFNWIVALSSRRTIKYSLITAGTALIVFFISYNLLMVRQYRIGIMHWAGMNKESYWYIFMKENFSEEQFKRREELIKKPDYDKMVNGERNQ